VLQLFSIDDPHFSVLPYFSWFVHCLWRSNMTLFSSHIILLFSCCMIVHNPTLGSFQKGYWVKWVYCLRFSETYILILFHCWCTFFVTSSYIFLFFSILCKVDTSILEGQISQHVILLIYCWSGYIIVCLSSHRELWTVEISSKNVGNALFPMVELMQ
jgi:hypothetical protein